MGLPKTGVFHHAKVVLRLDLVVPRRDEDQVHSCCLNLVLDCGLSAAAERNHGQNRGHADRQTDHRQRGLKLILGQRP